MKPEVPSPKMGLNSGYYTKSFHGDGDFSPYWGYIDFTPNGRNDDQNTSVLQMISTVVALARL